MTKYKNINVKESTWHGIRITVNESDHESQHQFIKSAVLDYAEREGIPVPTAIKLAMREEEPEPLEW